MSRNKQNRMPSGPIGPISEIAPRTKPGSKRPRVGAKAEGSKLISAPGKLRAALLASTPEIDTPESSPTEQSNPGSSLYSVIESVLTETTDRPCFPSTENRLQESNLSDPRASPERIYRDQSNCNLLRSPSESETDGNFFAEIHLGQNAPMPSCQGTGPLDSGAHRALCHPLNDSDAHTNYDNRRNNLAPLCPGVRAPVNSGGWPSGDSLEVPASPHSRLMGHHSEEIYNPAVQSCTQAAPEITLPKNPMTLLLQPFYGAPREASDDLVSSPVLASTGSSPSSRVFLQMEDIPRETYQFEGEWPSPPPAVLGFDSLARDSPPMPFCHGVPFPGSGSLLSPTISPHSGYPSTESSTRIGQACAPVGMGGLEDYGGPVDKGEDQAVMLPNPHPGVFSNSSSEHGTICSTPAVERCKWLNISRPGGEEGGEEAYDNLPHNWWEASLFSSPLEALNKPVDHEILRRNDITHRHSEYFYKPPDTPCKASNSIRGIDQNWHKIKLPLVTFRGPWQDIPNPDEDAMGGKYYGQILYSWASPKHKPVNSGFAALTTRILPIPTSMPTIPEGQQQVAKPLSIIERRMAKQRAGVRKSSRAKNLSLKK